MNITIPYMIPLNIFVGRQRHPEMVYVKKEFSCVISEAAFSSVKKIASVKRVGIESIFGGVKKYRKSAHEDVSQSAGEVCDIIKVGNRFYASRGHLDNIVVAAQEKKLEFDFSLGGLVISNCRSGSDCFETEEDLYRVKAPRKTEDVVPNYDFASAFQDRMKDCVLHEGVVYEEILEPVIEVVFHKYTDRRENSVFFCVESVLSNSLINKERNKSLCAAYEKELLGNQSLEYKTFSLDKLKDAKAYFEKCKAGGGSDLKVLTNFSDLLLEDSSGLYFEPLHEQLFNAAAELMAHSEEIIFKLPIKLAEKMSEMADFLQMHNRLTMPLIHKIGALCAQMELTPWKDERPRYYGDDDYRLEPRLLALKEAYEQYVGYVDKRRDWTMLCDAGLPFYEGDHRAYEITTLYDIYRISLFSPAGPDFVEDFDGSKHRLFVVEDLEFGGPVVLRKADRATGELLASWDMPDYEIGAAMNVLSKFVAACSVGNWEESVSSTFKM